MRHALLPAPLLLAPLLLTAAAQPAPYTVGGHGYRSLGDAVAAIGGGTGTILIAPGTYHDCAVQERGRVTYKAVQPGTAIFEGTTCEDKAALVLRGQSATVDGLVFRGYSVGDGNGEGIRSEAGDLSVANAMFLDSQQGIGGGTPDIARRIAIDHSTFAGLGQCDQSPGCAHSIYLITSGSVSVTNSRFERGTGGHYVKIRAPRVQIDGNSFDDSAGHNSNYLIDLPNGGSGSVRGNTFVQGPHKENGSTLIAVAAEERQYPTAGLAIDGNVASLAPGAEHTAFVTDWSHGRLAIGGNRLTGMTPFVAK